MARGVMEGHHSQKKINAWPMQEFNSPIVHPDVPNKNHIKENLKDKNKENKFSNHVTSYEQIKTKWSETTQEKATRDSKLKHIKQRIWTQNKEKKIVTKTTKKNSKDRERNE